MTEKEKTENKDKKRSPKKAKVISKIKKLDLEKDIKEAIPLTEISEIKEDIVDKKEEKLLTEIKPVKKTRKTKTDISDTKEKKEKKKKEKSKTIDEIKPDKTTPVEESNIIISEKAIPDIEIKENIPEIKQEIISKEEKLIEKSIIEPIQLVEKDTTEIKKPAKSFTNIIEMDENITVNKLAEKLNIRTVDLIKKMMNLGVLATINQRLDVDTATLIAHEYNYDVKIVQLYGEEQIKEEEEKEAPENLAKRAPIITVMGHVDHGKTSLLDAIRSTSVAKKEIGGITQHMGAYKVNKQGQDIVFIDTPGHEAFTAMRARGAQATDIIVLVVAADDGVMPQTIEAINHARAANVPIIVAVNKIDLPTANPDKVIAELSKYNLVSEKWGGKTQFVNISAKTKVGIDELLSAILLESEVMELKANPNKKATGIVLEGKIDKRKGPISTVLIQNGTIRQKDPFIVGSTYGRIRAMFDDRGNLLREAGPSTPIEIMGFNSLPNIGDKLIVVESDNEARHIGEIREQQYKTEMKKKGLKVGLENLHEIIKNKQIKELRIILKADVSGSAEALSDQLEKLSNQEVVLNIIHSSTGNITMTDVSLAEASNAIILGYHVNVDDSILEYAEKEGVTIRNHSIIFEAVSEIKAAMEGLLEPEIIDKLIGKAIVRKIFSFSKVGKIAGCYVTEGKIIRGKTAKVIRQGKLIITETIATLKKFKNDVKEVEKGFECGLTINNFDDIMENDIIEIYTKEKIYKKLVSTQ